KLVVYTWKIDTTNPTMTFCPPNTVTSCGNSTPSTTGTATATDGCSGVTISFTDVSTPGTCPTNVIIARTWKATDGCSNSVTCLQTIYVTNSGVGPVFTNCPANVNLGCNPVTIPSCSASVGAKSDCGLTLSCFTTNVVSGCLHFRTNVYTAVDSCNLTSTCSQVVT